MLPKFIVIGAIKSGTTSLFYYLNEHPDINIVRRSATSELDFFIEEKNWDKGLSWYESFFQGTNSRLPGESSGEYTNYPLYDGVPERMHAILPNVKLIYLVRDPIERMISEFSHRENALGKSMSKEISGISDPQMVDNSRYFMQITRYLDVYSLENIHFLTNRSMNQNPLQEMRALFRFLGVNPDFKSPAFNKTWHQTEAKKQKNIVGRFFSSRYKRSPTKNYVRRLLPSFINEWYVRFSRSSKPIVKAEMNPDLRKSLIAEIREDSEKFQKLSGLNLAHWSTINL